MQYTINLIVIVTLLSLGYLCKKIFHVHFRNIFSDINNSRPILELDSTVLDVMKEELS